MQRQTIHTLGVLNYLASGAGFHVGRSHGRQSHRAPARIRSLKLFTSARGRAWFAWSVS